MTANCPTCRKLVQFDALYSGWRCPLCASVQRHQFARSASQAKRRRLARRVRGAK